MPLIHRMWLPRAMLLSLLVSGTAGGELHAAEAPAGEGRVVLGVQLLEAASCPGNPPGKTGACVGAVRPGGAADRAGLRPGDLVERLNGTPIAEAQALASATTTLRIGQSVEVAYLRAGQAVVGKVQIDVGDWMNPADTASAAPPSVQLGPLAQADKCDDTMRPGGSLLGFLPYRKQPLALDRRAAERLLGGKTSVISLRGDVLTLAFRGAGGSAKVSGSIQCALDRVADADVWALQLRMPHWDQAFLSALFMAEQGAPSGILASIRPTATAEATFRGRGAPAKPAAVRRLRGALTTAMVPSQLLDAPREISVYLPPGRAVGPVPVLYMTDGQDLPAFAAIVEAMIESGRLRPTAIIAEHAGRYRGDSSATYDPRLDDRSREYLPVVDPPHFARHMRFFIEELLPWAERQYGLSTARADRAAMGYSNGAAFVAQLGLRHPEMFATVMPFSLGDEMSATGELRGDPASLPRFLFAGGELEPPFLARTRAASARLTAQGVPTQLRA
jgi:hypothetical protein